MELPESNYLCIKLRSIYVFEDNELIELRCNIDKHIDEYRLHITEEERRQERIIRAQETNTKNIADLTKATEGLVDAWNAANFLQKCIKWVSGFAIIGALITWFADKLTS